MAHLACNFSLMLTGKIQVDMYNTHPLLTPNPNWPDAIVGFNLPLDILQPENMLRERPTMEKPHISVHPINQ